jgi:hypothetical protein
MLIMEWTKPRQWQRNGRALRTEVLPHKVAYETSREIAGALGKSAASRLSGRSAYFREVPSADLPALYTLAVNVG